MVATFIALDWGTTSFRAYLVDQSGSILGTREGPDGILAVADGDYESVLERHVPDWDVSLPVLGAGMITSKQGWVEVPYCECPAGLADLAGHLRQHVTSQGRIVTFVPGLTWESQGLPDVMRGEETQVLGAIDGEGGRFVLPGTHSKWVTVKDNRIVQFTTYMTGEVYSALRQHTILGRLMQDGDHDRDAFARGVMTGLDHGERLLHVIFSARTLGLFDRIAAESLPSYLSGLLIGCELAGERKAGTVTLVGSAELCARYSEAFAVAGRHADIGKSNAAVVGLQRIGRAAGLNI